MNNPLIIETRFSILADGEFVEIEFKDDLAINATITAKIPYNDFLNALGTRLSGEKCNVEIVNPQYLGKIREHQRIEFKVADERIYGDERQKLAKEKVVEVCPTGWKPATYFNSQDSFFRKGEELWARTSIFRWVDKDGK